jgi:hypothetical protein
MATLVKRERNGDGGYDGQRPAIEELKTIDDDYGGSCYDSIGVKRATIFARESREHATYMREA